ncbi:hypothetical protein [Gimesia panareensis]|nr:hypothetical protein [Gimesia panareensis]
MSARIDDFWLITPGATEGGQNNEQPETTSNGMGQAIDGTKLLNEDT